MKLNDKRKRERESEIEEGIKFVVKKLLAKDRNVLDTEFPLRERNI